MNIKKLLPFAAITLGFTPLIVASCSTTETAPKEVEGVATQEILDKAIELAKVQYQGSKLTADKFRAKDFNTVEKLNAATDFQGLESFNKNDKKIVILEGGKSYTFQNEITKIEVDKWFSNIKVFWKIRSITDETLLSSEGSFTIEDFKVVTLETNLIATGGVNQWTVNPQSLKDFNDVYLTTEAVSPLPEDFDVSVLTFELSTTPAELIAPKYFTREDLVKIKGNTTNALDGFKPFTFDTYDHYYDYSHALFNPLTPVKEQQKLEIESAGDFFGGVVSNAKMVNAIKTTYFNNEFPETFATIAVNDGKEVKGKVGDEVTVKIVLGGKAPGSTPIVGKIKIVIGYVPVNINQANLLIHEALNDVKKFLIEKLAKINMLFKILNIKDHTLFTNFSSAVLKNMINDVPTYLPELQAIYDVRTYGITVKLFISNGVSSIVSRMADALPLSK